VVDQSPSSGRPGQSEVGVGRIDPIDHEDVGGARRVRCWVVYEGGGPKPAFRSIL
jgi:hypothetical protein